MKKLINTLLFLISVPNLLFAQTFSGGTGTEADPYLISNIADIEELTNLVNVGYAPGSGNWSNGKYFRVTQDITDGVKIPIGRVIFSSNLNGDFSGYFDGGNHKITLEIEINTGLILGGLFGRTRDATIINTIVDGYVRCNSLVGEHMAGVVGHSIDCLIKNCINYANITIIGATGAAGIVGRASDVTIEDCINAGTIEVYGVGNIYSPASVSGIVDMLNLGSFKSTIKNCLNIGDILNKVSIKSYCRTSGIVAYAVNADIINCINSGFIYAEVGNEPQSGVGGILGSVYSGATLNATISNCINTGVIEGNANVGAIAGSIISDGNITITNCHYDKQFCVYKGVNGVDVPGVSGHITRNMVGRKLANLLGDTDWTYVEGATLIECLYPQLKVFSESPDKRRADASKVGATPIFLYDGIKD
ncbi:MAG: hypothetical protein FWG85_06405 [Bacteroidetes bacterium]|nr:hypothetical protein [Bacteroidota bacterium]